jgi:hypothetical protein
MPGAGGYDGYGPYAGAGPSPLNFLYGMLGDGVMTSAPSTTVIIVHTTTTSQMASQAMPITQIQFLLSPSPILGFSKPPVYQVPLLPLPYQGLYPLHRAFQEEPAEAVGVPRYYKLSFPTFNIREDPVGWLNRCKQLFCA